MPAFRPLLGPALAVAFTALGWLRWRTPWSLWLLILATALLALAVLAPRVFAPIQAVLERFGRLVAAAFTWLLLGAIFLLIFVPARLLLFILRRDPLQRKPDPRRTTYWEPLPPSTGPSHFRRQY